jgi:FAD/FMN-containing dehydrogenase
MDIITADGRLLHADADEHADLFWAVRGDGGNFGVVTGFTFRLHTVPAAMMFCGPAAVCKYASPGRSRSFNLAEASVSDA